MTESYIQSSYSDRIGGSKFGKGTTIYKFEKIKRAKKEACSLKPDIPLIDLGVGEPDGMASSDVVATLQSEASKRENRGYADNGIETFKEAAANYLDRVFKVSNIDPVTEVNHSIGSKPALAMLPLAFINEGDYLAQTIPGYPVMATHTKYLGGEVLNLKISEDNNFLPDLDSIDDSIKKRLKLIYINYPNNPTGAGATKEFFEKLVAFAKANNVIVVHDGAYAALVYNREPLSFLSVDGAKDVGVELHSLSKSCNMTGWRIAFLAGNSLIVNGFATIKDNYDSGQFIPIQKAGITALNNLSITELIREKYERRMILLVNALREVGFDTKMPDGSFFLYTKAPKSVQGRSNSFESGEDFSQWLIKEKLISTVPWDEVAPYVRFSVTFEAENEAKEKEIIDEIKRRLSSSKFTF